MQFYLHNVIPTQFSISQQVWIVVYVPETGTQGTKKQKQKLEDTSINCGGVYDTSQNKCVSGGSYYRYMDSRRNYLN